MPLQNLVILGANSFVGQNIINNNTKYKIKAISRNNKYFQDSKNLKWFKCDILNDKNLINIVEKGDIVINCIYVENDLEKNISIIKKIIKISNIKKIKKLIHISTAVVSGVQFQKIINEKSINKPITEYQKNKFKIEEYFNESKLNFNLVILRPTAIFGIGGKNLKKTISSIRDNNILISILRFCVLGNRSMHLLYIDNFIDSIYFIIRKKIETNKSLFIISQDEDELNKYKFVSNLIINYYKKISLGMLMRFCLPYFMLKIIFKMSNKRWEEISTLYSSKKIFDLGFQFNFDIEQSVKLYLKELNQ